MFFFFILALRQNYISASWVITEIGRKSGVGQVAGECSLQSEGSASQRLGLLSFAH